MFGSNITHFIHSRATKKLRQVKWPTDSKDAHLDFRICPPLFVKRHEYTKQWT